MGIGETTTEMAKLVKKLGDIELYNQIISLQGQIMELMSENMNLKDQIRSLNEQLARVHDRTELRKKLEFAQDVGGYFILGEDNQKDGPYCQVCWDVDEKLVCLQEGATAGYFSCYYCLTRRKR